MKSILRADNIAIDLAASDKWAALDAVSGYLSQRAGVGRQNVLHALVAREKLGSTAIGPGVAIPHARMGEIASPAAAFARLVRPIAFGAIDDRPVDLILALIWPKRFDGFLSSLAQLCRLLREPDVLKALREARDPLALQSVLCPPQGSCFRTPEIEENEATSHHRQATARWSMSS